MINRVGAFLLLPPSPEQAVAEDFGILAGIPARGVFKMLVTDRLPLGQLALAGHVAALIVVGDASDSRVRRQRHAKQSLDRQRLICHS